MVELLPCPFCGGHNASLANHSESAFIRCYDCGTEGPVVTVEYSGDDRLRSALAYIEAANKAHAEWNKRKPTPLT